MPIGTVQKEAKVAAETPTIFESALVKSAKTGRFRPLDTLNPVNYEKYLKKDGTAGTLVGLIKLDMTESQAMARFPKDSITVGQTGVYAPVYKVMQEDGTQLTSAIEVPDRNNRFSEVEIYPEKLYRIGNPFKGDSDKVRQQVAPYVGVRNVKTPDPKKKQVLSA